MKTEEEKILSDTMKIINDFFYSKCSNSDLIHENMGHKGWYYMNEETAKKLKRQLNITFYENKTRRTRSFTMDL